MTALGGVPRLARGVAAFYQRATGPASAALAGARLREDQGKENRLQSKRPGAVCLQILTDGLRTLTCCPQNRYTTLVWRFLPVAVEPDVRPGT